MRAAAAALLVAWVGVAAAEEFPSKPIRIVVPYAAGGTLDMLGRVLGQKIGDEWGQPVVVDNKPGANGIIGTEQAAKAPADGYTLVMVSAGSFAINPSLYQKLSYEPLRDFAPVTLGVNAPIMLVAHPLVPAATAAELIAYAKANPGKLSFASAGTGSAQHLAGELFKSMAGIDIVHVPYKGSAPAVTDLLGGKVALMFNVMPTVIQHVRAGKLKAIGMATPQRSALVPDVPSIAESGLPGYAAGSWYGVVAPAGTPAPVIDKLNAQMVRTLRQPDVREKLSAQGVEPVGDTPAEFAELIRSEIAKYGKIVKDSGATAD
jgi:tripartite-type tricarboxylate transporter receptor subunit TctC